jgi:hypothetical protein
LLLFTVLNVGQFWCLSGYCLKKSSPLKQLGKMEPNLVGSIYVRSKPGIDGPCVRPFQKELILAAMFVGRMEPNEEALEDLT